MAEFRREPLAHQAQFVRQFLRSNAAPDQLLLAPPGLGKTFTAAALVAEGARTGVFRRVLVLVPAPLVMQWRYELADAAGDVLPIHLIGRQELRERDASVQGDPQLWPPGAIVMSIDFAKRQDVATSLTAAEWDLLILDEAHRLGGHRRRLIETLLRLPSVHRLLALTTTPVDMSSMSDRRHVVATDWTNFWRELRTARGFDNRQEALVYRRSPDEVAFLQILVEMAATNSTDSQARFVWQILLHRAASSLSAIEESLLRLSNPASIGAVDLGALSSLDEEETLVPAVSSAPCGDVDKLLALLDKVEHDVGLEVVVEKVGHLLQQGQRVCIFTHYVSTARYVAEALDEHGHTCRLLIGAVDHEERRDVVEDCRNGAVLVATLSEGVNLAFVDAVIHYDLPLNREVMAARRGHVDRLGRSTPMTEYYRVDESGVLPIEAMLRDSMLST